MIPRTIKELRREQSPARENTLSDLVPHWGPLVLGTAAALLPQHPDCARAVTAAVFAAFYRRWRRLSRRTLIGTWLMRSAWFAARRERKRLGLGLGVSRLDADSWPSIAAIQRLNRLPPKLIDAVVGRIKPEPDATPSRRLERRRTHALKTLNKWFRKQRIAVDAGEILGRLPVLLPPDLASELRALVPAAADRARPDALVTTIVRSWRWVRLVRALKRVAWGVAMFLMFLGTAAGVVAWLAHHGYLIAWSIRHSNRDIAKRMPEVVQPARPWPVLDADRASMKTNLPSTAAELYGTTNLWLATLRFRPDQWRVMEPSQVAPVRQFIKPDGKLDLRNPKASRSGLSGAMGIEFNWAEAQLDFGGQILPRVSVRFRGNGTYIGSLYGRKQSFKVDLNKLTAKQNVGGVTELNFLNCIADSSYLHDVLGEEIFRGLGAPGPRTAYAYLALDVPGQFTNQALGLYVLMENVDSNYARDRFGDRKTPIFKPVTYELFHDLGTDWKAYAPIYDLKTQATPEQWQRLIDFARLVTHGTDAEFAERLPDFLDLEEFAAFLGGHVLLSSYDGFLTNGQNYYLYLHPRSNKFGFIPWDQDHGWGEFRYIGTTESRENASIWSPAVYDFRFLNRVLKVEAFRAGYRAKLEQALATSFTTNRLFGEIDRLAAIIRPAVAAESGFRLKRFEQAVSSDWLPGPRNSGPEEGPRSRVHQIKRFIVNRIESVRNQLDGNTAGHRLNSNF